MAIVSGFWHGPEYVHFMIELLIKNGSWSPWCPGLDFEVSDVAKHPFISYSVSFLKMDSGALGSQGWILRF
jgi:hypothetical protein